MRGLTLDGKRIKYITKEIRQLQSKLENDKANERVDWGLLISQNEI